VKKLDIIVKIPSNRGIRIPDKFQQTFRDILDYCEKKRNGYLRVQVSPPYVRRSRGQQGLVHDWFQDIAVFTGNDLGHVKMAMKIMAMDEGWPPMRHADGSPVIDILTGKPKPMSEGEASIEEEQILLRVTERFAAEYGIELRKGQRR
jgi:hypothetical protein